MLQLKIDDSVYQPLHAFGLNEKEIRVYVASLELGPSSVNEIAKKSGIKRVTVYVYLETLKQKGFITETKRGSKRLIIAEDPESLGLLLERKKFEIRNIEKNLPGLVKKLDKIQGESGQKLQKSTIRYYESSKGIIRVYDEIFQNYTEIRTWVSVKNIHKSLPQNTLEEQIELFKNKGTIIKEIIEDSKEGREYMKKKGDTETTKLLPKKYKFPLPTDLLIYGKNIAMISSQKDIQAIVIDNTEIAETLKGVFDIMWDTI